ncbi:MAG: hypothetical protein ACLSAF_07290 [Intestinimonas sp.]
MMAPIMAMVVLLTAGMDVYDGMTGAYMTGATNFIKNYFLMFLTGAVFANLMAASGTARSIGLALAKLAKSFPAMRPTPLCGAACWWAWSSLTEA